MIKGRYILVAAVAVIVLAIAAGFYFFHAAKAAPVAVTNTAVNSAGTSGDASVNSIGGAKGVANTGGVASANAATSSTAATSGSTTSALVVPVAALQTASTAPMPIGTDQFTVSLDASSTGEVATDLVTQGFVQSASQFTSAYNPKSLSSGARAYVQPGAYKLSTSMTASQVATVLKGKPYEKWVVIPEGLRKEEIASLLQGALGWTTKQKNEWINVDTASTTTSDYLEGVYFPDTYLIPVSESTSDVAKRLISKFNEEFAPYLPLANQQNIKWTTVVTMASIIQREAANDGDMPLIAGILWNRLDQNMPLDVDATIQYIRGNTGKGWWAPITTADKQIDSPYNTYMYKGLPPHPISNPGLPAIEATLSPASTTCLYYLHDNNGVIHCADTYAEQQQNVATYLQN